jgi:hypothetical protein
MSTLQNRSTATLETLLSILFSNTTSLRLQLYELNKLRYEVSQAELAAAKSRRIDNGASERLDEGQGQAAAVVRIEQAMQSPRVSATAACQAGADAFSEAGPKSVAHHPSLHQRGLPAASKRRQPMEARTVYCEPKASANVVVLMRKQRPL